jgi:tellurite resistance protein TerC
LTIDTILWLVLGGTIAGALALDLLVFNRRAHAPSFTEAATFSAGYVALGLLFGGLVFATRGVQDGSAYLAGYLLELSLSVDNVFVFAMIFATFAVPLKYQHRVLFYGILGALIFRGIFITLGSVLIQFHWVLYVFGAFLIITGVKLAFASETNVDPEKNLLLRLLRRLMPITRGFRGQRFFVREGGRVHATPLLVALVGLEATDIVFAIDSVPAIFAVTREPFIVFTSNIFAILGLRSLYFLLGGAVEKFHLLRYGLAFVLVFVGLKMVWLDEWYGGKFPIGLSLAIIASAITASIVASLVIPPRHPAPDARVAHPDER